MKCSKDNTEMEVGFLDRGYWISGGKSKMVLTIAIGRKTKWVTAWRCPKCGKIELTTDVN